MADPLLGSRAEHPLAQPRRGDAWPPRGAPSLLRVSLWGTGGQPRPPAALGDRGTGGQPCPTLPITFPGSCLPASSGFGAAAEPAGYL